MQLALFAFQLGIATSRDGYKRIGLVSEACGDIARGVDFIAL